MITLCSNVTGVTGVTLKTYLGYHKYNVCVCVCVCVYSIYIFKKTCYTCYTCYNIMIAKVSENGSAVTTCYNLLQLKK